MSSKMHALCNSFDDLSIIWPLQFTPWLSESVILHARSVWLSDDITDDSPYLCAACWGFFTESLRAQKFTCKILVICETSLLRTTHILHVVVVEQSAAIYWSYLIRKCPRFGSRVSKFVCKVWDDTSLSGLNWTTYPQHKPCSCDIPTVSLKLKCFVMVLYWYRTINAAVAARKTTSYKCKCKLVSPETYC